MADERITELVELYFKSIPYSESSEKAKRDIISALEKKYAEYTAELGEAKAFDKLTDEYGSLAKMAVLAGYKREDAESWMTRDEVMQLKQLKRETKKQRRRIYLVAVMAVVTASQLALAVRGFFSSFMHGALMLLAVAAFGAITCLLYKKFRKTELNNSLKRYDGEAYLWLRKRCDSYTKKLINAIFIFFAMTGLFMFGEISFYLSGNSKLYEIAEHAIANIFFFEAALYLVVKNILCFNCFARRINLPKAKKVHRHALVLAIICLVFWAGSITVSVIVGVQVLGRDNIFSVMIALFLILVAVYDFGIRRAITYKNFSLSRRTAALVLVAAIVLGGYSYMRRDTWFTQPYINSVPVVEHSRNLIEYDDDTGVYTITSEKKDFKILHLTDIHLGGSLLSYPKDLKALNACYRLIAYTKPDLVVVTGDLSYPVGISSISFNNTAPVAQFAAFMRNLGIPWCFTYGNHDTESYATASEQSLDSLYRSLSYKTSGNLLYPYVQPDITGRNNQVIEIRNQDGTLNNALFLIDSNAYTGEGLNAYDYIHDDQVAWYESEVKRLNAEEGHTISSLMFFHIPLQQYRTANDLYEAGSDEVKYFFGANNESFMNKVCCSEYPSGIFDKILELGSTKGTFCGHDHYNNMSVEYKGVRLTYGMSIDYLAMPDIENHTEQRGGELITLHPDSSWDLVQIPLEDVPLNEI